MRRFPDKDCNMCLLPGECTCECTTCRRMAVSYPNGMSITQRVETIFGGQSLPEEYKQLLKSLENILSHK